MPEIPSEAPRLVRGKTEWSITELVLIAAVFLLLYLPFLSIDYDPNGVIEAMNLESGSRLSPNHILYSAVGRALYGLVQLFGYEGRGIFLLQVLNAVCGAIAVALAYAAIFELGAARRAALAAAGLWGTSAIYWTYATDVAYATLAAMFAAAALWCCASLLETKSRARAFLLGLLVSLAVLTFQMMFFLLPVMLWPLRRRGREAAVCVVTVVLLVGACYLAIGLSEGRETPWEVLHWAGTYAGGQLPEWGRFEMSRIPIGVDAAVRSFQWDFFWRAEDLLTKPFRPYVWRLGAGAICFTGLALITLYLASRQRLYKDSKFLLIIAGYLAFWPFIVWFSPSESYWFLIPNLFLCAAAAFAWGPWLHRAGGFALIFGGVTVMAAATFTSSVWNKHIDPGVNGRKVDCIARQLEPNDTVIAADWLWPAPLEYFHGVRSIQIIDLAVSLRDRDRLLSHISAELQETRQRQGRTFITDPGSYSPQYLAWLAEQTQFTSEDFARFAGRVAFQCEDLRFREVTAFK